MVILRPQQRLKTRPFGRDMYPKSNGQLLVTHCMGIIRGTYPIRQGACCLHGKEPKNQAETKGFGRILLIQCSPGAIYYIIYNQIIGYTIRNQLMPCRIRVFVRQ